MEYFNTVSQGWADLVDKKKKEKFNSAIIKLDSREIVKSTHL